MQNKTIKELTDTELKAIAYDNLVHIEILQAQIKTINTELQVRAEAKKATVATLSEPVEEKKTK